MFDFTQYMRLVCEQNKLARDYEFEHTTCSGINYLEGMLEQYQTTANFICSTDVCAESTFLASGGWFKRRAFMVFILRRYEYGNAGDYALKLKTCRELFRQITSRFIKDSEKLASALIYLRAEDIRSNELGGSFLNGCTGLYFQISLDEPTDLTYNSGDWLPTFDSTFDATFF